MRQVAEGVVLPDDIDDAQNGQLPDGVLVTFRAKWQLHRFAAPLFDAFFDAAKNELGFDLKVIAGSGNAYRPYTRQVAMFYERHDRSAAGNKMFAGQRWALRKDKANAATPVGGATLSGGRWISAHGSNHGWGLAADICHAGERGLSVADRSRLQPIGARFGLRWTALPSENWHVAAINAQETFQRLFGSPEPDAPAPVEPGPGPTFAPEWGAWGDKPSIPHAARPTLTLGAGFGGGPDVDWVRYLQGVLTIKGGQAAVRITGLFDDATQMGTLACQSFFRSGMDSAGWGRVAVDDWAWVDLLVGMP